jgi:hypothetical protein
LALAAGFYSERLCVPGEDEKADSIRPIENNTAGKMPIENTPTAKVPAANMLIAIHQEAENYA